MTKIFVNLLIILMMLISQSTLAPQEKSKALNN